MSTLVEKALRIALSAHAGQLRKDGVTPYVTHLVMVALILAKEGCRDEVVAAGLVHDVLEDTDIPESKLREDLGDEVADIVVAVTHDDSLPWEEKKKKYIESVRHASESAKLVATADKIDNLNSLIAGHERMGERVWSMFNRGKEKKMWFEDEMLQMLKETWQHPFIEQYEALLREVKKLD